MGSGPFSAQHLRDAHGPEQVDLNGRVDGRVEAHGRRRVDHHIGRCKQRPVFVAEAQAVDGDIAGDDAHSPLDFGVEAVSDL